MDDGAAKGDVGDANMAGLPVLVHQSTDEGEALGSTPLRLVATPQTAARSFVEGSGPRSRATDQSVANLRANRLGSIVGLPTPRTPGLLEKLQAANQGHRSSRAGPSRLEDSATIAYGDSIEDEEEVVLDDAESPALTNGKARLTRGRKSRTLSEREEGSSPISRVSLRRSSRIAQLNGVQRETTPGATIEATLHVTTKCTGVRKVKSAPATSKRPLATRRSARLARPLTHFHKYDELPPELRIEIWEAMVEPRAVYIRNRVVPGFVADVQNRLESSWFTATKISVGVAKKAYRRMFETYHHTPNAPNPNFSTQQLVNPNIDIVVLEPCCNGCRGYHCARHQFKQEDREAVRFLAVQTESPGLHPATANCWVTISNAWPNVETLYLAQIGIKGDSKSDKALIRIKEREHETLLRKKFESWKETLGAEKTLTALEFVAIVDREPGPAYRTDRYASVEHRLTGLREDIILG